MNGKIKRVDWIVVGGGFAGIAAAYLLAREKYGVCLIDSASRLGGAMNGFEWNGFQLDVGCQLRENKDPGIAEMFVDLLYGEVEAVEHSIASITASATSGTVTWPCWRQSATCSATMRNCIVRASLIIAVTIS